MYQWQNIKYNIGVGKINQIHFGFFLGSVLPPYWTLSVTINFPPKTTRIFFVTLAGGCALKAIALPLVTVS